MVDGFSVDAASIAQVSATYVQARDDLARAVTTWQADADQLVTSAVDLFDVDAAVLAPIKARAVLILTGLQTWAVNLEQWWLTTLQADSEAAGGITSIAENAPLPPGSSGGLPAVTPGHDELR